MKRRVDPLAGLTAGHLAALEPTPEHMATFEVSPSGADRLARYRSMRDASKTPEPVPERAGAGGGWSFVIQEHHARRLHWDFRLEKDGLLVSWALPKGVPSDVKSNHLAVQTEDHPLEYGAFEGHIPEGEYGGGEVTIWDSGQYELEKWREDEEVIVTLNGDPGGGLGKPTRVALIHTGGEGKAAQNWLIHLMKDQTPGVAPRRGPGSKARPEAGDIAERTRTAASGPRKLIPPMLATLGTTANVIDDADIDWAFEMKWDGIRAIAYVEVSGDVRLFSRNGNDVSRSYPDLLDPLRQAVASGSAVLDGEIVAVNKTGRPDFGLLQTRMKLTKKADVEAAARKTPVQFMLFDLLEQDGRSLVRDSYDERRVALQNLVFEQGPIHVPPAFEGNVLHAMDSSRQLRLEGVLAKRRSSSYSAGRRSRAWIKIKHHLTQEVVIGGWRPGKGNRLHTIGSLLVGVPVDGGLRYIGRVGTGFGEKQLAEMESRFDRLSRTTTPFLDVPRAEASDARWITPNLVGEVEFAEWTPMRRLRQASWRGWRPDKSAAEVVEES